MTKRFLFVSMAAPMALMSTVSSAAVADFTDPEAKRFLALAWGAAGADEDLKFEVERMCTMPTPSPTPRAAPAATDGEGGGSPAPNQAIFPGTRIFDNMYYFGSPRVGANLIQTSAGLILVDTLTYPEEVEPQLFDPMRRLGLNPADIKYVIITHGHGDHYGGLSYIREHVPGIKVIATEADWPAIQRDRTYGSNVAPGAIRTSTDIGYEGTYRLELGNQVVDLHQVPGHTPGTTSLIYSVRANGTPVTIMQWGGGGPQNSVFSMETIREFAALSNRAKAGVRWGNHPRPDDFRPSWTQIRAAVEQGQPNPANVGPEMVSRYWDIVLACKQAGAAESSARGS